MMHNKDLFSFQNHDMNKAKQSPDGKRLFYVTNRYNLNEILSSGLIAPRAAFGKYYEDLLSIAPGRLPLFAGTIDRSIIEAFSEETSDDAYPAILEVDPAALFGTEIQALQLDGSTVTISSLTDEMFAVCAPSAVIPRSAFRMVHFLSDRDMADYRAHPLSNVRTDPPGLSVTTDIISEGSVSFSQLKEWMRSLVGIDQPDGYSLSMEDRIGGAVVVAKQFANPDAATMRCLMHYAEGGVRNEKDLAPLPELPRWLNQPLRPRRWEKFTGLPDDEESSLFRSAVSVLSKIDRHKTSDRVGILGKIREDFRGSVNPSKTTEDLVVQLDRLEDLLNVKEQFKGFKEGGSDVVKALLLVLLKFKLEKFLERQEEKFGDVSSSVRLTAGILFGLIDGRKILPLSIRDTELDDHLTFAAASTLATDFQMIGPRAGHRVEAADEKSIDDWLEMADFATDPARSTALAIIEDLGLQGCVETVVIPPSDSPMEMFYTKSHRDGRRKVIAFRMNGEAEVTTVIRPGTFSKQLRSGLPSLSEEMLKRIREQVV